MNIIDRILDSLVKWTEALKLVSGAAVSILEVAKKHGYEGDFLELDKWLDEELTSENQDYSEQYPEPEFPND